MSKDYKSKDKKDLTVADAIDIICEKLTENYLFNCQMLDKGYLEPERERRVNYINSEIDYISKFIMPGLKDRLQKISKY